MPASYFSNDLIGVLAKKGKDKEMLKLYYLSLEMLKTIYWGVKIKLFV